MKWICVFLVFSLAAFSYGQKGGYSPKGGKYGGSKTRYRSPSGTLKNSPTDVFPIDPEFRLSGWYGDIGLTYMFPMKKGESDRSISVNDTTMRYQFTSEPGGKIGPYIAVGYFHAFQDPRIFHFWDVGLTYRQYKGKEEFSGKTTVRSDLSGQSSTYPTVQANNYTDQAVSIAGSIANHRHFSRYGFIQNAFGLNVDYFFSKSRPAGPSPFPGYEQEFHGDLQAQLHYRLGVGWKASKTLLIVPSVTFPLITAWPFESGRSSLAYYATRQYPIIISIRFMLLRPLSEDCNVPNYDGPSNFEN